MPDVHERGEVRRLQDIPGHDEGESGTRFEVDCRFIVFLAGTVNDRFASYDFVLNCK